MIDVAVKRWFASDGIELAYRETGQGRPVILVHGLFSDGNTNWVKFGAAAAVAAGGCRVIMPDLRAHGLSGKPHDPANYPDGILGRDLAELVAHLGLGWSGTTGPAIRDLPLHLVLALGGIPLVLSLVRKLLRREFGSDLLAGISIVTAALLGEYLAGAFVVLMLSGGEALEGFAVGRASSVLQALARRMPQLAHRQRDGEVADIALDEVRVGNSLILYPHEICPVDGVVPVPDDELPGIDYVIPDFSYALAKRGGFRGVVLTHGHEDHIGALPYLLKSIRVPVPSGDRRTWPAPAEAPSGPSSPPDNVALLGASRSESATRAVKRPRTIPTPSETSAR